MTCPHNVSAPHDFGAELYPCDKCVEAGCGSDVCARVHSISLLCALPEGHDGPHSGSLMRAKRWRVYFKDRTLPCVTIPTDLESDARRLALMMTRSTSGIRRIERVHPSER